MAMPTFAQQFVSFYSAALHSTSLHNNKSLQQFVEASKYEKFNFTVFRYVTMHFNDSHFISWDWALHRILCISLDCIACPAVACPYMRLHLQLYCTSWHTNTQTRLIEDRVNHRLESLGVNHKLESSHRRVPPGVAAGLQAAEGL
jgi:hypothetical protein